MNDGDSDGAYLFLFRSSASLAIAAIPVEVRFKRLGASVSGQVKSHARHLPSFHGIKVMPSGRFWSLIFLDSDLGSSREGISADISARLIISLTAQWREKRPAEFLQLSP